MPSPEGKVAFEPTAKMTDEGNGKTSSTGQLGQTDTGKKLSHEGHGTTKINLFPLNTFVIFSSRQPLRFCDSAREPGVNIVAHAIEIGVHFIIGIS